MISIVAVHAQPTDSEAFDHHYREVHTPLVQRIPGVLNVRYGHVLDHPAAAGTGNYLVCDTYFANRESLDQALASPEMAAALDDVPNFSTGGVTIFFAEVDDHAPATPGAE